MEVQALKRNGSFPKKKVSWAMDVVKPKPTQKTLSLANNRSLILEKTDDAEKKIQAKASEPKKIMTSIKGILKRRLMPKDADDTKKKIQVKATEPKQPHKIMSSANGILKQRRLMLEEADDTKKKKQMKATESKRPQKIMPSINGILKHKKLLSEEAGEAQAKIQVKVVKPKQPQKIMPSVNGALKKRRLILEEDEADRDEEIQKKTTQHDAKKKTQMDWKVIKRQKQREAARVQIEQTKNTAGFNHNMEAMRDFYVLISKCSSITNRR